MSKPRCTCVTLFTFRLLKEEICFSDIYCFQKHRGTERRSVYVGGEGVRGDCVWVPV